MNSLSDLLVLTAAAVLFVPLFRWLKLGAILAYLFAGVLIGPDVAGLVKDPAVILHFSELGVVFLLFVIGLELAPRKLWNLRRAIFGLGLSQVLVTGALFTVIGRLLGLSPGAAVVAGFGISMSSTAFGIQILEERRQLNTTHGQGAFSILMLQDLAVIPLIASLDVLSEGGSAQVSWAGSLKILLAVGALILVGTFVIRYVFRFIAQSRIQEVFIAMSLFIVIGSALLMESLGLSMGLGAFMAGVLLAESEYRHELESSLAPFKGLLLGLFFIAVGMSLDLHVIAAKPHWVLALAVAFMGLKGIIIYGLGRIFGYASESARNMAFALPQGGEFAFVLFSAALAKGLLDTELASMLGAAVTISMGLTPFLFSLNQRLRTFSEISERPFDQIQSNDSEVIIAGFGRVGQIVARFLNAEDVRYTILELDAEQVDSARKFGNKVYYGDAARADILEAAGAAKARIFVLAIDDPDKSVATAGLVKKKFPNLAIIARARNRQHALKLMELGITNIHRETYLTSLEMAKEVMVGKGQSREVINPRLARFRAHDEEILRNQFKLKDDEKEFISYTRQANRELEAILRADREKPTSSPRQNG